MAFNIQNTSEGLGIDGLQKVLNNFSCFSSIKLAADNICSSVMLQDIGFRQVDTSLTFCATDGVNMDTKNIRVALPEDRERVVEISGQAFSSSRFHLDPQITNDKANKIKCQWAENYFYGKRGDYMIVAEDNQNRVQGFCQILSTRDNGAVIDLIGISPKATGQGLGTQMISFLWKKGVDRKKPNRILVGTQAANIGAVNFYEKMGFRLIKTQNILHFSN